MPASSTSKRRDVVVPDLVHTALPAFGGSGGDALADSQRATTTHAHPSPSAAAQGRTITGTTSQVAQGSGSGSGSGNRTGGTGGQTTTVTATGLVTTTVGGTTSGGTTSSLTALTTWGALGSSEERSPAAVNSDAMLSQQQPHSVVLSFRRGSRRGDAGPKSALSWMGIASVGGGMAPPINIDTDSEDFTTINSGIGTFILSGPAAAGGPLLGPLTGVSAPAMQTGPALGPAGAQNHDAENVSGEFDSELGSSAPGWSPTESVGGILPGSSTPPTAPLDGANDDSNINANSAHHTPTRVGAGSSGSVQAVHFPELGRYVAVKTIRETTDDRKSNASREIGFARRLMERASEDVGDPFANLIEFVELRRDASARETRIVMEYLPYGPASAQPEFQPWSDSPQRKQQTAVMPDEEEEHVSIVMEVGPLSWDDTKTDLTPSASEMTNVPAASHHLDNIHIAQPLPVSEMRRVSIADPAVVREAALRRVALGALNGLRVLHNVLRVVHRDITPRNLLVTRTGTVKIIDFGCASLLPLDPASDAPGPLGEVPSPTMSRATSDAASIDASSDSRIADQAGSVAYMSPERLRGEPHGPSGDVWSLGVCLLELANANVHPFLQPETAHQTLFWRISTALRAMDGREAVASAVAESVDRALKSASLNPAFGTFVRNLLHPEASQRPRASDLLHDPWLTSPPPPA